MPPKKLSPYEGSPTQRFDAVVAPSGDLFKVGDVLNEVYEVRGILGQGGMGQVFDAYDRFLNRAVAIKVAWPNVGAATVRKEAQALAAIRHSSMVVVYACGIHQGTEYVVMERVAGLALESHIRRRTNAGKPFAFSEAIEILACIAEGLAAVHHAGVAHRDIKPDNIMLAPGGRVVIMDFGVFMPEFEMGNQASTSGSPAYMAPETISGNVGGGGGFLVDVYAFGVIAFEMLTGELPFPGATARDIYMKHLAAEVPTIRSRRPDVPPALDTLVAALMLKDPTERPQSMEEVAHQLRSMLLAPPSSKPESPSSKRMPVSRTTRSLAPMSNTIGREERSSRPIPAPSSRVVTSRIIIEESPVVPSDDDD